MATYTEPNRMGEFLAFEVAPQISRETVTIADGSGVLKSGTVLGKITATGLYAPYIGGNSDGTEVAAGVLLTDVDSTDGDVPAVAIARLAVVKAADLIWDGDNSPTDKVNGKADLATLNIIVR